MSDGSLGKLYARFYKMCHVTGTAVIAFAKIAVTGLSYAAGACRYAAEAVAEFFSLLSERVLNGRGRARGGMSIARTLFSFISAIGAASKETAYTYRTDGVAVGTRKLVRVAGEFFLALWRVIVPILNIGVPTAAVIACAMVINNNSDFSYGISVTFKGENIGIIENEGVFNSAVTSISSRVENATGEKYHVEVDPAFELVTVSKLETFATAADIEERIIANSPELFRESTGLYINGELMAVTDHGTGVQNVLDTMLEEARLEYEETWGVADAQDIDFGFVDQVELREGLYPVTQKKTVAEITELLTSSVSEEQTYTVQSGDSPKAIAKKFELTDDELYALNPGLEDQKNIYPGDVLVIGNEVAYLPVQMSCTLIYEEETDIPVKYIETDSYYEGVTKVKKEGEAGINKVTAQVTYVDGVETGRIITETVQIKEAVEKEVYRGTNDGFTLPSLTRSYIRPIIGGYLSSPYGYRTHPVTGKRGTLHTGIDIAGIKRGTPIYAAASGTITFRAYSGTWGNLVKVDHGGGYVTWYAHCNGFASGLKVGDRVEVGETIAYVGDTGRVTGVHLHFEIRYKNQALNVNDLFPDL